MKPITMRKARRLYRGVRGFRAMARALWGKGGLLCDEPVTGKLAAIVGRVR